MQTEALQSPNDNKQTFPTFNPLTHIPPSYDIYGHQIPPNPNQSRYNILAEKDNIKVPWDSKNQLYKSTPMTRTKLLERRKKERIPDISYDLDGDGFVGGRDYVLSKRYDVDRDGKLNEIERKLADLNKKNPELNILKIFELRYKQNLPIENIAEELQLEKQAVVTALDEIVELI
jgi:hypothetical protein